MNQKTKVLLVEDHDVNRTLLKSILQVRGFEVIEAENGMQCLSLALSERPNLILLDIGLPDIDGLSVTKDLKRNLATASIPIIAITAHAFSSDKIKALAAGCSAFLTKPVPMNDLVNTIHATMTAHQQHVHRVESHQRQTETSKII